MPKTLPLLVSNSEIQTWKDCRRRWYLTYYRELGLRREDDSPTGARQLGSRIHVALKVMYEEGRNPVEVINEIYAEDIQLLITNHREDMIVELQQEQDLAKAMLEGYVQWVLDDAIDAEYDLVAPETVIEVPSGLPNVHLRGKLDQRFVRRSDKARLFRDFKTVGSLTEPLKILRMDEQMKFYHLLEQLDAVYRARVDGDRMWRTDGALYTMLRKVKRTARAAPPFYGQVEVRHNRQEIKHMWTRVHKILKEIWDAHTDLDAGADHQYIAPPRPSRDCVWKCDFLSICPMMDDGSNVDGIINERYEHRDPHERYAQEDEAIRA